MNRIYENLFIVKPDVAEEDIDTFIETVKKNLETNGATIDKVEKWGKRRLAYRVEKQREGFYVLLQFTAEPTAVKEFERRMRVADMVIKYLTVRIDELLKRLDKKKKEREKRALRKPAPVAPQPSLAQAMLGGPVEGAPAMPGAPIPAMPAVPMPGAPVSPEAADAAAAAAVEPVVESAATAAVEAAPAAEPTPVTES